MKMISALMEAAPGSSLAPSTTRGCSKKTAFYELGSGLSPDTKSAGALTLNFPASRTGK